MLDRFAICNLQLTGSRWNCQRPHHYHLILTASTISPPIYVRITATSLRSSATTFPTHRMNRSNPVLAVRRQDHADGRQGRHGHLIKRHLSFSNQKEQSNKSHKPASKPKLTPDFYPPLSL